MLCFAARRCRRPERTKPVFLPLSSASRPALRPVAPQTYPRPVQIHPLIVLCLAWNPVVRQFLSFSGDNTICLWDAQSRQCLNVIPSGERTRFLTATENDKRLIESFVSNQRAKTLPRIHRPRKPGHFPLRSRPPPRQNTGCDDTYMRIRLQIGPNA